jgi:hypothetical protein
MKTRMEKEIYLMLHTRLDMREILRMRRAELDQWVQKIDAVRTKNRRRDGRTVKALVC